MEKLSHGSSVAKNGLKATAPLKIIHSTFLADIRCVLHPEIVFVSRMRFGEDSSKFSQLSSPCTISVLRNTVTCAGARTHTNTRALHGVLMTSAFTFDPAALCLITRGLRGRPTLLRSLDIARYPARASSLHTIVMVSY